MPKRRNLPENMQARNKKRRDKLLNKIKQNHKNVRFEDLKKLYEMFGYEIVPPRGGSHYVVVRGTERISFSKPHGKRSGGKHINEIYVKEAIRRFEQIIESEEE